MGTIDAGRIAAGRDLNLDPVEFRAAELVELAFAPLEDIGYHFAFQSKKPDLHLARARAVEFAEKNGLPCAKLQVSLFHRNYVG